MSEKQRKRSKWIKLPGVGYSVRERDNPPKPPQFVDLDGKPVKLIYQAVLEVKPYNERKTKQTKGKANC